jgi:N-methylhydantoinase A
MTQQAQFRIAVDIGGTFTDGVAEEAGSGRIWVGKCLTTPDDPGEGISTVIDQLIERIGGAAPSRRVSEVVHGTTIVTNALIERQGVATGAVITGGTADILDIGRETRYDLYDLALELPVPLIPREHRFEVDGRLDAEGRAVRPITKQSLDTIADAAREAGLAAMAVCLLHSYANDDEERAVADALRKRLPGVSISLSSRVAREIGEFERLSTTAANAYVQPLMEQYLQRLEGRLRQADIPGTLRIMLSSGGFTSATAAAETPILLLESGPAAGVISAVNTGQIAGVDQILAFDMGGTTAKACIAVKGAPEIAHRFEAARVRRFKRGSGLPILIPSIDLIEIGAGGGSVAHADALGLLKVGPRSAGSVPGPACYDRGNPEPTVTDADLVLGYLDADSFLGGEMHLRKDLAEAAIARLGEKLGLGMIETACGIVSIVDENMAAAARVHVAEKGMDPRSFTLVATGGAGPVHAVQVGHKLGVRRLLCPVAAGAGSCLGLLAAPARVDRAWSRPMLLDQVPWDEVATAIDRLHRDATAELVSSGTDPGSVTWSLALALRYVGQGSTIPVTLPFRPIEASLEKNIQAGFDTAYRRLYGDVVPGGRLEVVTWRLAGQSAVEMRRFTMAEESARSAAPKRRPMYLPISREFEESPVYERYALDPGTVLRAPLLLEERESTIAVPVPATVTILPDRTVLIELDPKS